MLIPRPELTRRVQAGLRTNPVTALLGPRQCGKTTLARGILARQRGSFFDLEDPRDWTRLQNPQLVLERLTGGDRAR